MKISFLLSLIAIWLGNKWFICFWIHFPFVFVPLTFSINITVYNLLICWDLLAGEEAEGGTLTHIFSRSLRLLLYLYISLKLYLVESLFLFFILKQAESFTHSRSLSLSACINFPYKVYFWFSIFRQTENMLTRGHGNIESWCVFYSKKFETLIISFLHLGLWLSPIGSNEWMKGKRSRNITSNWIDMLLTF